MLPSPFPQVYVMSLMSTGMKKKKKKWEQAQWAEGGHRCVLFLFLPSLPRTVPGKVKTDLSIRGKNKYINKCLAISELSELDSTSPKYFTNNTLAHHLLPRLQWLPVGLRVSRLPNSKNTDRSPPLLKISGNSQLATGSSPNSFHGTRSFFT